MPRLTHQTPKYRKHRASGQAFVELNGHRHYLGPHGTKASHREYDRLVSEWLANNRQPVGQSGDLTIAELIVQYWQDARKIYVKDGRPTGEQGALKAALKPVKELYGRHPAAEFGPLALEAVRNRMVEIGWARGNINRSIDRVRRLFRWGVRKQLIPPAVIQGLEAVPGLRRGKSEARETKPILPVDDGDVEQTLEHLPDVVADMVRLERLTGMRPAEVCVVRPCDIDRSSEVWVYRPESHKTEHHERERIIPIGPKAQGVLLRYLAHDPSMYCFRPCDSEAKRRALAHARRKTPIQYGNTVGTNRKSKPRRTAGECYNTDAYRRAIHRACDKTFPAPEGTTGKELREWQSSHRWSPNQLRHTAGTDVRRQFGLEAAQVFLGHSQANVTQVYAERDLQKGLEVAAKIG